MTPHAPSLRRAASVFVALLTPLLLSPGVSLVASASAASASPTQPERLQVPMTAEVRWEDMLRLEAELAAANWRAPMPPSERPEAPGEIDISISAASGTSHTRTIGLRGLACPPGAQAPSLRFNSLGLNDSNTSIPPDTQGAVGPTHLMTTLNTQVRIQNRTNGTFTTVSLATFWSSITTSPFDPKIVYDKFSQRWYFAICGNARNAASRVALAVSATSDPTGVWRFYSFDADAADAVWADFPGLGLNQTWVAITANMFTTAGDAFSGAKIWMIDRASVAAGPTATVTALTPGFDNTGFGNGSTLQPVLTQDAGVAPLYLVDGVWTSGASRLIRVSQITGTAAAPVWSSIGFATAPYPLTGSPARAPQLGSAALIDAGGTALTASVFQNGSIWTCQAGNAGAELRAVVNWAQIEPTAPSAIQGGTVDAGANVWLTYPSIAVNCGADVCLGFSRLSATQFAEAAFATRLGSAAPNTFGPVRSLKAGEAFYDKTFGGTRVRWGDYSSTCVDPLDDRTFWTLQEYAATRVGPNPSDSRWGAWWGSLPPGCRGDFDQSGARTIDDIFLYINAWFTGNPRCDVDGLPGVTIDDLFVFINIWFAGC